MNTFKSYYDYEKDCWDQEINLIEVRNVLDKEYKKNHPVKHWFKQLFKKLRGVRK